MSSRGAVGGRQVSAGRGPGELSGPCRKVLIVEDDPKIRAHLLFQVREVGLEPQAVPSAERAAELLESMERSELAAAELALLLLDVRLPGMSGVDLVRGLAAAGRLPTTIIITGEASITETVEALRLGVYDLIEKPFTTERLRQSIANALEHRELQGEVAALRERLEGSQRLLGSSEAMARLGDLIKRVAPTEGRVLIRGESGVGKELVADALHRGSRRARRPFIKINCAAIPASLVEDELFGHERGAFTGADRFRPGLFEEASGGTLLLDEIGDMDVQLQARLLRTLEDGRIRRVGSSRDLQVDVRILAATNQDLEAAVREGRFRQDLYFRLAHLVLDVPPLRDRPGDVMLLLRHFLDEACRSNRLRPLTLTPEVAPLLERYPWPGNVRELRSLCERLAVLGTDPIGPDQLPSALTGPEPAAETGLLALGGRLPNLGLRQLRHQVEKEYIELVLRRTGWSFAAAARHLGIRRTYLHHKAGALGIVRPVAVSGRHDPRRYTEGDIKAGHADGSADE